MTANIAGPIWGLTPKTTGTNFINATGAGTKQTIFTAGANGSRILAVEATTDDTSANDVNLFIQPGGSGTVYRIGGKRVTALSGAEVASTIAAVNLLDATQLPFILSDGSIQLAASDIVQASTVAVVTTAKTLTILVVATDY